MKFIDVLLFSLVMAITIPPCFAASPGTVSIMPSAGHIVLCLVAASVLVRYGIRGNRSERKESGVAPQNMPASRAITAGASLVAFGVLCVSSAVAFAISGARKATTVSLPKGDGSARYFLLCAAAFLLSAFYEETIYRAYLPLILRRVFCLLPRIKGLAPKIASEAVPVLLFACAHKYSGLASVFNALVAAAVLRLCFVRSRSLAACIGVHSVYNMLQLVLIAATDL